MYLIFSWNVFLKYLCIYRFVIVNTSVALIIRIMITSFECRTRIVNLRCILLSALIYFYLKFNKYWKRKKKERTYTCTKKITYKISEQKRGRTIYETCNFLALSYYWLCHVSCQREAKNCIFTKDKFEIIIKELPYFYVQMSVQHACRGTSLRCLHDVITHPPI